MKYLLVCLAVVVFPLHASSLDRLQQKSWIHGAENCKDNRDPAIDVFQFNEATYILRQNKCVHYEAPFIYVFFGGHTVFVQDTGATEEADKFPLYETVQTLIAQWQSSSGSRDLKVLVTHSHSHSDHVAGDPQFMGRPGVTLVAPNAEAVRRYFGFTDWPEGIASIDLGGRELTIIPTPGHQDESIAVYDSQTQWLLTGDSLYPGRLYIRDWNAYKSSIQRLVAFSENHEIAAVLGTHIEMSDQPGKDYRAGTRFQPEEASLVLTVEDLVALDNALEELGKKPRKKVMAKFIISPVGLFQRTVGGVLRWLGGGR